MRIFAALANLTYVWLLAGIGIAHAATAAVDPFLQAAQWAEENPADETSIDCGDEVSAAGALAAGLQQRNRWTALAETPLLIPSFTWNSLEPVGDEPLVGPRLSLTWENDDGVGVRGRAWGFDSGIDVSGSLVSSSLFASFPMPTTISHEAAMKAGKIDLDLYKRFDGPRGYITLGGSLTAAELTLRERYVASQSEYFDPNSNAIVSIVDDEIFIVGIAVDYNDIVHLSGMSLLRDVESVTTEYHDGFLTTTYQGGSALRTRGYGPGVLTEGEYRLAETPTSRWALFGRARLATLFGPWEEQANGDDRTGNGLMTIFEGATGVAYRRQLGRAQLIAQCAFEAQCWDVAVVDRIFLTGVTTGIGLGW